jgi:hypothetical protein
MAGRPRERIMGNLESVFRDAYERAKGIDDPIRMADLDSSYQREQLLLEVLLDIRDSLGVTDEKSVAEVAIEKINMLRKIVKPR